MVAQAALDILPGPLVCVCLSLGPWTWPVREEDADRGPAALLGNQKPATSWKMSVPPAPHQQRKENTVSASIAVPLTGLIYHSPGSE